MCLMGLCELVYDVWKGGLLLFDGFVCMQERRLVRMSMSMSMSMGAQAYGSDLWHCIGIA
jgi:hypothetical protein